MRLVGTTKTTIAQIRDRTHWNSANLTPADPVTLGLCSQIELDMEVEKAGKVSPEKVLTQTLLPVEETTSPDALSGFRAPSRDDEELDAEAVFAKLNALSAPKPDEDEDL
jgi:hypothetical protein